jgi:hypothetical protein
MNLAGRTRATVEAPDETAAVYDGDAPTPFCPVPATTTGTDSLSPPGADLPVRSLEADDDTGRVRPTLPGGRHHPSHGGGNRSTCVRAWRGRAGSLTARSPE